MVRGVPTPLIDILPPDTPELQSFDVSVTEVEHRRPLGDYAQSTVKAYQRRYRKYVEWCSEVGYQTGPDFITTEKITEYVQFMVTVERYMPKTIVQALRALEIYAGGAGKDVSREPAEAILDAWVVKLRELKILAPKVRTTRR